MQGGIREKREANQQAWINKAFEKTECFDGSNPNRCLPWLEQIHAMSNSYDRNYCEEQIKDIVLHSHSNLKTLSQRLHAFNSIQ